MRKAIASLILWVPFALTTPAGAQDARAVVEGVQFNERVVELTEPVVRRLVTGLEREVALLTGFRDLLGTYKTTEQYDACNTQVAMSPEAQKIAMRMANLPTNSTTEQVQGVTEKMNTDMNALLKKRCGDNIDEEWPPGKRMGRVQEIHQQAAAAAGLLLPGTPPAPPPPRRGGPWIDDAVEMAQQAASTAPYDIAEERIDAYCKYKKKSPSMFPMPPGYNLAVSASIIDPFNANLRNNYFMYTPAEMAAIEPMCGFFKLSVGKIEVIMDDIKITGKASKKRKN